MTTRYNYKWSKPVRKSEPIKVEWELIIQIEPISFVDEEKKVVKEYKEISKYVCKKTKWSDFIKSFDLGSPSEQVINHLTKGTPLVTAHTLPAGDYTKESILKGAEIVREMNLKGITLEMVEEALNSQASASGSESGESE